METQELHRGRLIDHLQWVVRDLAASQTFYEAVFKALQIPMGAALARATSGLTSCSFPRPTARPRKAS